MCGFAGLCSKDTQRQALVTAALKAIRHRGPDDEGIYRDDAVALGHARLSVLDLSPRGHQPMKDRKTGRIIVYNGEIYNFRELKASLRNETFVSDSDTEV